MGGRHEKKKTCKWCKGAGGYDAWDRKGRPIRVRCGRCAMKGQG
ncbi:hypothetical protein AB0C27_39530 [Nonomuraea sp. NPDC048882]